MLSRLTRGCRIRAILALAALYTFCVLAPSMALAFADGPTAFHCLTDQHGIADSHDHGGKVHMHADGTAHRHHDGGAAHGDSSDGGKSPPRNCCGLFCMSALAGVATVGLVAPIHFTFAASVRDEDFVGRGPDRIDRPPIA